MSSRNYFIQKVVHPDGMEELVVKIADFGLSALVRVGERGYDGESSMKRKSFHGLIEVIFNHISCHR
jgi:hypothetical protein